METIIVACPHCEQLVEIMRNEVNCAIFRHGIYKANLKQMDPHAPKDVCDELVYQELIYGCGKPFKLILKKDLELWRAETCDYV